MSREFGRWEPGYFHTKVRQCADDALDSDCLPITQAWGRVLREFELIAYAIASAEAGETDEALVIFQTITDLDQILKRIDDIAAYIRPFQRVSKMAIELKLEQMKTGLPR